MSGDLSPLEEHIAMTRAAHARVPAGAAEKPQRPKWEPTATEDHAKMTREAIAMAALRERSDIAGYFGAHVLDRWVYPNIGETLRLEGGEFDVLYAEDLAEFGITEDGDPYGPVYLRRKADGAVFEVEVECTARRMERKQAQAAAS